MSVAVAPPVRRSMPRMASSKHSPMDRKRKVITEDKRKLEEDSLPSSVAVKESSPPSVSSPVIDTSLEAAAAVGTSANAETVPPLAPPPRPNPSTSTESGDYFSGKHAQYSLEPNLFEASFSHPTIETPGKSLLPSIAALTSPAPLPGNANGSYAWSSALRSGPLSPAMLSGPAGVSSDYFDPLRSSFPTPNESSLRTGLTPGGGGTMFPAPSPGTQSFLNQLNNGVATPGTLEFQRTALNAARKTEGSKLTDTTHRETRSQPSTMDLAPASTNAHFGQHDNDAANGLYLLAQAGNESSHTANQFAAPQMASGSAIAPDTPSKRSARNIGSSGSVSDADGLKPNTRGKNKRTAATSTSRATNGRRKAGDSATTTATKVPAAKRAKNAASVSTLSHRYDMAEGGSEEEVVDMKADQYHENGKKMTEEEKRKNFLERNRVAALKCRQRKKQWLANLQQKVEIFSSENDTLASQVSQLRDEILRLKTILIAHKDCPIGQQGPLAGVSAATTTAIPGQAIVSSAPQAAEAGGDAAQYLQQVQAEYAGQYGLATMPGGQQVLAGGRRFS